MSQSASRQLRRKESFFKTLLMKEFAREEYKSIIYIRKVPGSTYGRNFPDLIGTVLGKSMLLELKMEPRFATEAQANELNNWRRAGAFSAVVTYAEVESAKQRKEFADATDSDVKDTEQLICVLPTFYIDGKFVTANEPAYKLIENESPWFNRKSKERAFFLPVVKGFGKNRQAKRIDISSLINRVVGEKVLPILQPLGKGEDE